jgi:hypothetical protein
VKQNWWREYSSKIFAVILEKKYEGLKQTLVLKEERKAHIWHI